MRYLPQTEHDIKYMLKTIGVDSVGDLFRGVPDELILKEPLNLPPALSEPELRREMLRLAGPTPGPTFLGAGAYPHSVPAAVEQLLLRSELYTAYTPYQPEVSQGTLQTMFEFQTMVCELLGLDVANASLYDCASSTAEAVLMALRIARKRGKVILCQTVHPEYRETTETFARTAADEIITVPYNAETGQTDLVALEKAADNAAAIVMQSPNFFGLMEDGRAIAKIAQEKGALLISAVPEILALGLYESPGAYGADISTSEGLGYGVGVQVGGPACGLFAAKQQFLRQLPGRIVGETVDSEGHRGYVLTLSTREQHIRREKATSNICTNQGLLALGFAMHLALLGKQGFVRNARQNMARALRIKARLADIGITPKYEGAHFNELAYKIPNMSAAELQSRVLEEDNVVAGLPVSDFYGPEFDDTLLLCTTEVHSPEDIERLLSAIEKVVKS